MAQTQHEDPDPVPGPPREPAVRSAAVPRQRGSHRNPDASEIVVRLDVTDAALDRVVEAVRRAAGAGLALRLLAADGPGAGSVVRDRFEHQLAVAAELARAVAPQVEVRVGDGPT